MYCLLDSTLDEMVIFPMLAWFKTNFKNAIVCNQSPNLSQTFSLTLKASLVPLLYQYFMNETADMGSNLHVDNQKN